APDQIVGFAQLYGSFSSLALCPSLILNDLFVLPEARGLGVGRSLVGACAAFARGIGASSLSLSTQHANAAALALYESLGFVRDEEFVHLALALPASPARSD
ncbi:MAG: GNAT family N-acetyltransferase, partial [Gemmatimonadaceae bacterium]